MTGMDLIRYIILNNLENELVFSEKGFLNLMSESEAALKLGVGPATIRTWFELGLIQGLRIGDNIYISPNANHPFDVCAHCGHIRLISSERG